MLTGLGHCQAVQYENASHRDQCPTHPLGRLDGPFLGDLGLFRGGGNKGRGNVGRFRALGGETLGQKLAGLGCQSNRVNQTKLDSQGQQHDANHEVLIAIDFHGSAPLSC